VVSHPSLRASSCSMLLASGDEKRRRLEVAGVEPATSTHHSRRGTSRRTDAAATCPAGSSLVLPPESRQSQTPLGILRSRQRSTTSRLYKRTPPLRVCGISSATVRRNLLEERPSTCAASHANRISVFICSESDSVES